MSGSLLIIGIIWLVYHLVEEASWNTNAYNGKQLDIEKMFYDTNVRMTLGQMSKSEFKRNYKNGNYSVMECLDHQHPHKYHTALRRV